MKTKDFFEKYYNRIFLGLASLLFLIRVSSKIHDASKNCHWPNFLKLDLIIPLLVVVFVYTVFLILARYWSRILQIPASFLFLIAPFLLYFTLLLNNLFYGWNDQLVLLSMLAIFTFGLYFLRQKSMQDRPLKINIKIKWWGWILIGALIFHGVLLFLGHNLKIDRTPFSDEGGFWYAAAKQILENGFLAAHQASYPGGNLHPLGVPFLNALPGLIFKFKSPMLPFFMPVYILFGLTLILSELANQKSKHWQLIFLLIAWFAAFNNRSWLGMLFHSMVYGESISMILVLGLLNWLALNKEKITPRSWGTSAFLIGLLALTKFPLLLLSTAFFIALLQQA